MLIYIITNDINDKVYIGQTVKTLEERKQDHFNTLRSGGSTHIYNAMRKYGWEHFSFAVLATAVTQDELDDLEDMYILKYDSIKHGYNMMRGGRSNPMDSEIVRAKHLARMQSADVRNRIGHTVHEQIQEQGGRSEEYRRKMSEGKKELYASERGEAARQKFRQSFRFTPEHFRALNDAKNKKVYCINQSGEVVAKFDRVKDAAQWWYDQGYIVKDVNQLCDKIKESSKKDKFYRGLKWVYCV